MSAADQEKKSLDVPALQQILQGVDPAVVLVSSRILERVIREHFALPNMYWNIPHSRSFVCNRQELFRHAEQVDLDLAPGQILPETVILLLKPAAEELSFLEKPRLVVKYWRRLFHSRIHLALESSAALNDDAIRDRIEQIGRTEFEEIRAVLIEDRYLPPAPSERQTYVEFAAVYLELRYFAQNLLRNFFPGIRDFGKIEKLLARDVDAAGLFVRTRLPGAPDPILVPEKHSDESQEAYWKLVRAATRAERSGNLVRAAITRMRASRIAPAAQTLPTRIQAEQNVAELATRLSTALHLSETETTDWTEHLTLLLDKADQGVHPTEAAVLFELQNVCQAHDREVYVLDLFEWVTSMGRRPIKRPLPSQKIVRIINHLRAAVAKLTQVRLADTARGHLERLMQTALDAAEERLRERFAPTLITAMADVGLKPSGPIEQAAFDKMVAELLDRIMRYGFLTFAELRDTISRNQLKLPDVKEPEDFLKGDPLIRLDRRLGSLLDGVYRPGEFYVRHLERATSLGFGTWWGRWVTRYVVGPLMVAWLALFVLGLLLEEIDKHFLLYDESHAATSRALQEATQVLMGPAYAPAGGALLALEQDVPDHTWAYWHVGLVLLSSVVLLLLLHNSTVRHYTLETLAVLWRGLTFLFWRLPRKMLPVETVRRIVETWVFQLLYWYVLKPAFFTGILVLIFSPLQTSPFWTGVVFVVCVAMVNSRPGRAATEGIRDGLLALGVMLRSGLLIGVVRFITYVFKRISDLIEWVLFTVDEYLRFRSGDSRTSLVVRTLMGVLWTPVAFLIRFYYVVLIEPCINPLKLPVSSLAAKVIYPLMLAVGVKQASETFLYANTPEWLAWTITYVVVYPTLFFLPDAFGFLAWEMKENWSLYRSNRGDTLRPVAVGAHGETIRGLLLPGFHSGTVPALFAKLREAEREAVRTRSWQKARQFRHEVEEMEAALLRFLAREVVALLKSSKCWQDEPVEAGGAHLATNRIRFELIHAEHPSRPIEIEIEQNHGWIVAGLRSKGWLDEVTPEQKRALATCLAGAYKLADVDLVREQLIAAEASAGRAIAAARLTDDGVQVWREQHGEPVTYDLRKRGGPAEVEWLGRYVFSLTPISWRQWNECWQKDSEGRGHPGLAGISELVLPSVEPPPGPVTPTPPPDADDLLSDGSEVSLPMTESH